MSRNGADLGLQLREKLLDVVSLDSEMPLDDGERRLRGCSTASRGMSLLAEWQRRRREMQRDDYGKAGPFSETRHHGPRDLAGPADGAGPIRGLALFLL